MKYNVKVAFQKDIVLIKKSKCKLILRNLLLHERAVYDCLG